MSAARTSRPASQIAVLVRARLRLARARARAVARRRLLRGDPLGHLRSRRARRSPRRRARGRSGADRTRVPPRARRRPCERRHRPRAPRGSLGNRRRDRDRQARRRARTAPRDRRRLHALPRPPPQPHRHHLRHPRRARRAELPLLPPGHRRRRAPPRARDRRDGAREVGPRRHEHADEPVARGRDRALSRYGGGGEGEHRRRSQRARAPLAEQGSDARRRGVARSARVDRERVVRRSDRAHGPPRHLVAGRSRAEGGVDRDPGGEGGERDRDARLRGPPGAQGEVRRRHRGRGRLHRRRAGGAARGGRDPWQRGVEGRAGLGCRARGGARDGGEGGLARWLGRRARGARRDRAIVAGVASLPPLDQPKRRARPKRGKASRARPSRAQAAPDERAEPWMRR